MRVMRGAKKEAQIYQKKKNLQAVSKRDLAARTVISGKGKYQATGLRD